MSYRRWLELVARALATLVGLAIIVLAAWLLPIACEDVPAGDLLAGVAAKPDGTIHVVTVLSHPDDETFYVGGTLIKLKTDPRVRLHILCATDGGKDEAKDKLHVTERRLGRIRLKELALASEVLGADEVSTFDYADRGLAQADQTVLRQRVRDALLRIPWIWINSYSAAWI